VAPGVPDSTPVVASKQKMLKTPGVLKLYDLLEKRIICEKKNGHLNCMSS